MGWSDLISGAEEKHLKTLESYFLSFWGDTDLPSHDLDHHRRVWNNVKEILLYYPVSRDSGNFACKLLIASYFHDIGMARDKGIRHGSQSRKVAEEYLVVHRLDCADYLDVLDAIEYHDNKEYDNSTRDNTVLEILSVADDIDAFGNTGIRRYLEIYRARGIGEEKIGYAILENAASRFANFELFAAGKPGLLAKHKEHYEILKRYFQDHCSGFRESSNGQ